MAELKPDYEQAPAKKLPLDPETNYDDPKEVFLNSYILYSLNIRYIIPIICVYFILFV